MLVIAAASETPLHYLSVGTNINLGTSKEMKWPFVKKIQRKQELYARGFEKILKKVMFKGNDNAELDIQVKFPPIYDYDLEQIEAGGLLPSDDVGEKTEPVSGGFFERLGGFFERSRAQSRAININAAARRAEVRRTE